MFLEDQLARDPFPKKFSEVLKETPTTVEDFHDLFVDEETRNKVEDAVFMKLDKEEAKQIFKIFWTTITLPMRVGSENSLKFLYMM